ncbi:hypothetical protein CC2G_006482 [Coprinopsis cinerea AmutBmut pab1-1]|nr:hypothetical protein CC2G_006482 [Coprinopsis cinerea AmutBmut pab1-1]
MRDDPSLRGLDDDREGGEGTVDIAESPALGGKSDEDIGDRPTDVPPPGDDGVVQRFFVELPSDSEDDSAGGGHTKQGVATADDGTEKSSHIDLTSPSNDTSVCDSPPTGPSFAISQPIVSNRYLREHIESLRWMKEELRKRNNLLVRLRELMKRDLEEIERAIRLRDEEEILDE